MAVAADGNVYISDRNNQRIRRISPNGIITTIAGTGEKGFGGDGGPAIQAKLNNVNNITMGADGTLYLAEEANQRIRRISPNDIITTVAGTGVAGFSGDGGLAIQAKLNAPVGIAVSQNGNIYIADFFNNRIRRVSSDGIITTVAGTGTPGFSGDGGPATQAKLNNPFDIAVDTEENLYIADFSNFKIRVVTPEKIISTIAGINSCCTGVNANGILATQAWIDPYHISIGHDKSIYIVNNNLIITMLDIWIVLLTEMAT